MTSLAHRIASIQNPLVQAEPFRDVVYNVFIPPMNFIDLNAVAQKNWKVNRCLEIKPIKNEQNRFYIVYMQCKPKDYFHYCIAIYIFIFCKKHLVSSKYSSTVKFFLLTHAIWILRR